MNTDDKDSHNKDIITTPNTKSSSTDVTDKDSIPTITPSSLAAFSDEEAARTLLILTGATIAAIPKQAAFFADTARFKGAICCRVTPKQKSDITLCLKNTTKQTVLAVGDGGNDVSMIQNASIGVGLLGKEGKQAARAADFVIGEYRLLKRLLCVHGVQNYSRSWTITFYSLYKSVVLCSCQCVYSFYSLFSGSSQFNSYYLTYYSIAIFLPIAALVLKRVFPDEQLLNNPAIYRYYNRVDPSHHTNAYRVTYFVYYLLLAVAQGALMELLFLNGVGCGDRDFLSHSVFFCLYGLQDIMLLLLVPNVTALSFGLIFFLHLVLFALALLQSSTGVTGGMVPFMSLNFAMSRGLYWPGKVIVISLCVLVFALFAVFGNKEYNRGIERMRL